MTSWDKLLMMMDRVLGFENKTKSSVRKVKQVFDETTNEHVIWLEYRTRVDQGTKQKQSKGKKRKQKLLHQINTLAKKLE